MMNPMETMLWYEKPAKEWKEGLPIGNGRLAAMVWGGASADRLSLNHEWIWRGLNRERNPEPAAEHLEVVRAYLRRGDFFRATCLANTYFGGYGGESGVKSRVDPFQPAGDLHFALDSSDAFLHRELDIMKAVATVKRRAGACEIQSEFMAHSACGLILCRWSAGKGRFSGSLRYTRAEDKDAFEQCVYAPDCITYDCAFKNGIQFRTRIVIKTDGVVSADTSGIHVSNATEITAYIGIATNVVGIEEELARHPIPEEPWDKLMTVHEQMFSMLINTLSLELLLSGPNEPTDKRIELVRCGKEDPALLLLYFNYGRYLLASSSICGELPANLQGKWNDRVDPPWESDYHFDINIQMNYWAAEEANMPACTEGLLRYIERMVPSGRMAARDIYGCRGTWLPLSSDAWGCATPEGCGWAVWIGAAAWIAQHFWRHYEYNGDLTFLRDRAYPYFTDVALFYEDYLVDDENGTLQIMPSQSPENSFAETGFWPVSIGISSAMDVQLAYDALDYAIRSASILGVDEDLRKKWREMKKRLPPFTIGPDGRLLEWDIPRKEPEPGHRHLSHLYGLYPSDLFNPADRPEEYLAAAKSLDYRLSFGGGHTGWSRAWVACLSARLGRSEDLWRHLCALIFDFATDSLLDLHPPGIFQIDGNLGAVEAILQGLVQSWGGKVHLLRALPQAWPNGRLRGVKTPGGHVLSLAWNDGILKSVDVTLGYAGVITLAGLAGKFKLVEYIQEQGDDIVIRSEMGTTVKLVERNAGKVLLTSGLAREQ